MTYKEYIDLGFERIDLDDNIEFNQTGYGGFVLEYRIKHDFFLVVDSHFLNTVKLYISKIEKGDLEEQFRYHIIAIDPDMAKRMIEIFKPAYNAA